MEKITKKTTFQELLQAYPEAAGIISSRGLHCLGCSGAIFESIEQGSKMHGLGNEEIDKMVSEINSKFAKSSQKAKKAGKAKNAKE